MSTCSVLLSLYFSRSFQVPRTSVVQPFPRLVGVLWPLLTSAGSGVYYYSRYHFEFISMVYRQISSGKTDNFHPIYSPHLLTEFRAVLDFILICKLVLLSSA